MVKKYLSFIYLSVCVWCVCVCVCVIHCCGRLVVSQPVFSLRRELRASGRAETTLYTTHRDSEATTPQVTSRTYLLLGEQELEIHFKILPICLATPGIRTRALSCLTGTSVS